MVGLLGKHLDLFSSSYNLYCSKLIVSREITHVVRSPETAFDTQRAVVGPQRWAHFQGAQHSQLHWHFLSSFFTCQKYQMIQLFFIQILKFPDPLQYYTCPLVIFSSNQCRHHLPLYVLNKLNFKEPSFFNSSHPSYITMWQLLHFHKLPICTPGKRFSYWFSNILCSRFPLFKMGKFGTYAICVLLIKTSPINLFWQCWSLLQSSIIQICVWLNLVENLSLIIHK